MKKNSGVCAGFILLSFILNNVVDAQDINLQEQDYVDNASVDDSNLDDRSESKAPVINKVKGNLANKSTKEIEVNSINFIKLKNKANEIFIPDPTVVDIQLLSDNSLYLIGLAPGETTLVINDKHGNVMVDCKVRVTHPIKAIKSAIASMHPDAQVDIMSLDKSIVLRGRVPSPEVAADVQDIAARFVDSGNIVNKLVIETAAQVMLKVKIAEVTRELAKSLGVSWRTLSTPRNLNGMVYGFAGGNTSGFIESVADADALKTELMSASGMMKVEKASRWVVHNASGSLTALIDALATESFASVLAEPTIIALSGKTAKFKSGGEQGYTVKQEGSDNYTTEFKDWGTEIEFTPIVLSEDRINITVTPKVSTVTLSSAGIPQVTSKEASTTIELGSGQSLAIAGLLQTNQTMGTSETPLLADIPLVGALFRDSNVTRSEKELVIIVTPYIVKPSSKRLKTPIDMIPKMYSPLESILTRKFHKNVKKVRCAGFSIK